MNGRPNITQLNQAVAEFGQQVSTAVGAALHAYHAKVASNLQDIAEREAVLGPAADVAELARLRALFAEVPGDVPGDVPSNVLADLPALQRRLCQAIANGSVDLATPGLAEHLWSTALDQAAIDQPSYSTHRRHRSPPPAKAE